MTNNTDGAALLPVTQSDGDLTLALIDSLECSTDAPDAPEWAAKFREELADRGFIIARHATQEDAERSGVGVADAWERLKAICCADAKEAKRCVMVSKEDFFQALSTPHRQEYDGEAVREALAGFGDDYMTSDQHHPGYVLIPTDQFERILAALKPTGGNAK